MTDYDSGAWAWVPPAVKQIMRELESRPCGAKDLSTRVGFSSRYCQLLVRKMHAAGLIHVCRWVRREGGLAIYAVGKSWDAPRLVPLTAVQRKADWRQRQRRKLLSKEEMVSV